MDQLSMWIQTISGR